MIPRWSRCAGVLILMVLSAAGPLSPAFAATAPRTAPPAAPPAAPAAPVVAEANAPLFADTLTFSVGSITPEVATADAGNTLAVRGTVTNTATGPVTDLIYRVQRGPALTTRNAVERQLADPREPEALATSWQSFGSDLAAGAAGDFGVATAIAGNHRNSLRIPRPGIYPVMINVNGTRDVDGNPAEVRVGQIHLLLTVTSVPDRTRQPAVIKAQVPISWIWKLSSAPHRGVGGIFLDESLAAEIAPGGRLAERLKAVRAAGMPAGSLTLAVDPLLLDELTAMSRGYWVQKPGTPQGRVTSVPSSSSSSDTATTPTASGPDPSGSAPSPGEGGSVPPNTADDADPATGSGGTTSGGTAPGNTAPGAAGSSAADSAPADDGSTNGSPDGSIGDGSIGATESPATAPPTTATSTTAPSTTAPAADTGPAAPPSPDVIAGTGRAAATAFLDDLRAVAATTPILVLPYSDPDSVALTRAGETGDLAGLIDIGRTVARNVFTGELAAPLITDVALPPDAIADPDTVQAYADQGFRSVVLDGSGVIQSDDHPGDGLARVADRSGTAGLPALVDDSPVQDLIDTVLVPTADTSSAEALNAAVAMIARRSFDGDARPLVRLPDAVIDTGGLSDLAAAMRLFDADGVLDPASPAELAAVAAGGDVPTDPTVPAKSKQPGVLRAVVPVVDEQTEAALLSPAYLRRLSDRRLDLTNLHQAFDIDSVAEQNGTENTVGSGAPALALLGSLTNSMTPLRSVTLRSAAGNRAVTESVLTSIDETVQYLRTGVSLASSVGSYTLAGTDSPLLLTVQNTLPFPVMVTVRIDGGDTVGLRTEQPDLVALPAQSSRQVSIPTTVTRAGSFTVSAQLVGPDGLDWNVSQTLRIRSNAYGAVTIILIVVAGGVLLLMVVLRIWQRWKERQRRLAAGDEGPAGPDGTGPDGTEPDDAGPKDPEEIIPAGDPDAVESGGGTPSDTDDLNGREEP